MISTETPVGRHPIPQVYDPARFAANDFDREFFKKHLDSFVPPDSFDAHAHWYDLRIFAKDAPAEAFDGGSWVGYSRYRRSLGDWMAAKSPRAGLFFPMPARGLDIPAANALILDEAAKHPDSRVLLMLSPNSDPATVEQEIKNRAVAGFKVYHLFAARPDTQNAGPEEFIPEWAWELADQHGLCIMLHLVMQRSLAELRNQDYIRRKCIQYPNARLILAHAGRGFCGRHAVEGIDSLRGLANVYFDTSVACEPEAMQAILAAFGTQRLMFGTDFPLSESHARAVNLGDGFHWLYEQDLHLLGNQCTLTGIESLLALKQACRTHHLTDTDVERIFRSNAVELLGIRALPAPEVGAGQKLYSEARNLIPGGVQLASKRPELYAPGKWPSYFSEARGYEVFDLDGRRYFDFATNGIGTCLLGYAHPAVTAAVLRRVQLGSMSTLNSPEEVALSRMLVELHPWAERVRLARTGGEALAVAVRIARAATRRDVIGFCGYHGWSDWYLAANLGDSDALNGHLLPGLNPAGVPRALRDTILPFSYNKIDELKKIVNARGGQLAAVIMEPLRSAMPEGQFLHDVRQLCDDSGAALIFDEVTTGFRLHHGGIHLSLGVTPDVAVFAKALGNGHPIAAIIGKAAQMDAAIDSFISSSYWTEGVGPTAAVATLQQMQRVDVPAHVRRIGVAVREVLGGLAGTLQVPLVLTGLPAQTYISFDHPQADALMTLFTSLMLDRGYLCGAAFYPTLAHDDVAVQHFAAAAQSAFGELSQAVRAGDVVERIGGRIRHSGFRRLN
jgi:glutamate-1-semialdehyde 2,1-aminomutase